ncbi:MAG: hypothetical protein AABY26_00475 [Nanoarchaeota archaeon]
MKDDNLTPEGDKAGIEYQVELWEKYHILVPEEFNEWPPRKGVRLEKADFGSDSGSDFPPYFLPPIPRVESSVQTTEKSYKTFGGR